MDGYHIDVMWVQRAKEIISVFTTSFCYNEYTKKSVLVIKFLKKMFKLSWSLSIYLFFAYKNSLEPTKN